MAVPLERRQKDRQQRLESFPADPITRLSEYEKNLLDGFVMKPESSTLSRRCQLGGGIEQPDLVLSVTAGDRH